MGFIYCNIGGIVCSVSSLWDEQNISETVIGLTLDIMHVNAHRSS